MWFLSSSYVNLQQVPKSSWPTQNRPYGFYCCFVSFVVVWSFLCLYKDLWPNKPLHQCNNPNKTKTNWIRKSPSLTDTNATLPDGLPAPKRGDGEGRPENHVFAVWEQFKYPLGVVLSISEDGSSFDRLSQGQSLDGGNSQGFEVEFPPEHSQTRWIYGCQGL